MKRIFISIVLLCLVLVVSAQERQTSTNKNVKKTDLTLRPNSREFSPVRKTNTHQRMEMRRARTMIQNKNVPRNINRDNQMRGNNANAQLKNSQARNKITQAQQRQLRTRQEMIKRQQQRMLRRKMIMQQRKKMRR